MPNQDLYVLCRTFYANPVHKRNWKALTDKHKARFCRFIERTSGGFFNNQPDENVTQSLTSRWATSRNAVYIWLEIHTDPISVNGNHQGSIKWESLHCVLTPREPVLRLDQITWSAETSVCEETEKEDSLLGKRPRGFWALVLYSSCTHITHYYIGGLVINFICRSWYKYESSLKSTNKCTIYLEIHKVHGNDKCFAQWNHIG